MSMRHSYEDWGAASIVRPLPDLLEAFSGTSIVRWAATIKYKLGKMVEEEEANRNDEYARLLRTFLNTWEANPITGSINRETLEVLKAAANPLSVMKWNPATYFQGLSTSLDELIADQEQLPAGMPDENGAGPGGPGFSGPPMGNDFGPEENAPPGGPEGPEGGKPDETPGGAEPGAEPGQDDQIPIK